MPGFAECGSYDNGVLPTAVASGPDDVDAPIAETTCEGPRAGFGCSRYDQPRGPTPARRVVMRAGPLRRLTGHGQDRGPGGRRAVKGTRSGSRRRRATVDPVMRRKPDAGRGAKHASVPLRRVRAGEVGCGPGLGLRNHPAG